MWVKSQDGSRMTSVQSTVDVRCAYNLDRTYVLCSNLAMGWFTDPGRADQVVSEMQTLISTGGETYRVPAK